MSKNLFSLIAVFSAVVLAACQPNPTPINSTHHQVEKPKAAAGGGHSSSNANGNGKTANHQTTQREPVNAGEANHSQMNHSAMQSAPNAAAQAFDLQFLDTMIVHHEGAIEMARAAEAKTQNADLKIFAARVVADQTREINQMKQWRGQWFAGRPSALNMEMAGMADSMKGMNAAKMNAASGASFDAEFASQMTAHHQGAVVMAREALTRAEHAEIKTLANQIIQAQEAEIKQMAKWMSNQGKM